MNNNTALSPDNHILRSLEHAISFHFFLLFVIKKSIICIWLTGAILSYTFLFSHLHLIQNIKICFSTEAKKKHCAVQCTMYVKRINSVIHCWHFTKGDVRQFSPNHRKSINAVWCHHIYITLVFLLISGIRASHSPHCFTCSFSNSTCFVTTQYGFNFVMNNFDITNSRNSMQKRRKVFINFLEVFCKNIFDNLRKNEAPI